MKIQKKISPIGIFDSGYGGLTILEQIKKEQPDIFVCGHSHILLIQYNKIHNLLHINPGAAGKYGFHKSMTMIRFEISGDNIKNMEIWEKPK